MGPNREVAVCQRRPICPGGTATFNGCVDGARAEQQGMIWAEIDIEIMVEKKKTRDQTAKVKMA